MTWLLLIPVVVLVTWGVIELLAVGGNTSATDVGSSSFSGEIYDALALDIVIKEGLRTNDSFAHGTVERCTSVLARIPAVRERLRAEVKDRRLLRHVEGWVDFYEREAKENLEDCRTQTKRKMYDEVGRRMDERNRRKAALAASLRST